jgi:hypothetical protein
MSRIMLAVTRILTPESEFESLILIAPLPQRKYRVDCFSLAACLWTLNILLLRHSPIINTLLLHHIFCYCLSYLPHVLYALPCISFLLRTTPIVTEVLGNLRPGKVVRYFFPSIIFSLLQKPGSLPFDFL